MKNLKKEIKIMTKLKIMSAVFSSIIIGGTTISMDASAGYHSGTISTLFAAGP
ncbi:hypothetical protein AZA_14805 [Nitrospirillum viridazoti Y2]|nr:hypothetical protein AZA_14805 [Nitrospirillum amazonense Y2]